MLQKAFNILFLLHTLGGRSENSFQTLNIYYVNSEILESHKIQDLFLEANLSNLNRCLPPRNDR